MDWMQFYFMLKTLFVPVVLLIVFILWLVGKWIDRTASRRTRK